MQLLGVPLAALTVVAAVVAPCVARYRLSDGVGDPWGSAVDSAGNVWFAGAGCDFEANCSSGTPSGQLGVLYSGSQSVRFYTLPQLTGNQPIFVAPDAAGHIWFTTPNNSEIGEFDPATETFVGEWPVSPGSGPWDLVFAGGALWYTERFSSAVGRFDPATHSHADFPTPTPGTHPYGIAAQGSHIWFAENETASIGSLDTASANEIVEYPLQASPAGSLTPHMLSVDDLGHIWWSGGWLRAVGELDPARATPRVCGARSGECVGITEYALPPSPCHQSHVSGLAVQRGTSRVWLTDSLSGEVGYFDAQPQAFTLWQLNGCDAHSHDGLSLDPTGRVWWTDEFSNALNTFRATS